MRQGVRIFAVALVAGLLLAAMPLSAVLAADPPDVVWVCPTGDCGQSAGVDAFNTIQAGIDAVAPGGTVSVAAGTYNEAVVITKPVTLRSISGAASTIIDGNSATGNRYLVTIEANDVTVDGFTITKTPTLERLRN